jgi:rare lipoprotein A
MRRTMYALAGVLSVCASAASADYVMISPYAARAADIAAHNTLPFGTKLRVMNPRNGRSMILVIRDRGPVIRGRTLTISNQAAQRLGFVDSGVLPLDVRIVSRK